MNTDSHHAWLFDISIMDKIFTNENCSIVYLLMFSLKRHDQFILRTKQCQAVEREEKDWEREVLRDTERF